MLEKLDLVEEDEYNEDKIAAIKRLKYPLNYQDPKIHIRKVSNYFFATTIVLFTGGLLTIAALTW